MGASSRLTEGDTNHDMIILDSQAIPVGIIFLITQSGTPTQQGHNYKVLTTSPFAVEHTKFVSITLRKGVWLPNSGNKLVSSVSISG